MSWLNMVVMCLPAFCGTIPLQDGDNAQAAVIVVRTNDDGQTTVETSAASAAPTVRVIAVAPQEQRSVTVTASDAEPLPKVWIGVRLTAVPAPLAAHIGERGVMIANVVRGGPAEQAGVDQYDVVVGFNGQDINRPQDLTAAIGKTAAGQPAKLTIVRKGKPQELAITPTERTAEAAVEWKYTEPQDDAIDAAVKMYGRTLQRDPSGVWTMKDLGQLRNLPEALKELENLDVNVDLDKLNQQLDKLQDSNVFFWKGDGAACTSDDKNVRVQVKIKVDDDGKKIAIQTGEDGKIQVTHTDAEGNETTATYDNAEQLEKADPEAFKFYSEHCGRRGMGFMFHSAGPQALKLRHEFQIDVQKKLEEALAAAKKARTQVGQAHEEAMKEFQEKLGKAQAELSGAHAGQTELLMVRVNDDGSIKVVVTENGEKTEREFKSRDELKSADPALYARLKDVLE